MKTGRQYNRVVAVDVEFFPLMNLIKISVLVERQDTSPEHTKDDYDYHWSCSYSQGSGVLWEITWGKYQQDVTPTESVHVLNWPADNLHSHNICFYFALSKAKMLCNERRMTMVIKVAWAYHTNLNGHTVVFLEQLQMQFKKCKAARQVGIWIFWVSAPFWNNM